MSVFLSSGSPTRRVEMRSRNLRMTVAENAFLHEQPRTGTANVALIEINSGDNSFNRLIDRRVFENDVGRLAAEFERQFLLSSRHGSDAIRLPNFSRTGERDLVDIGMIDERAASFARAGHDVNHAFGQLRLLKNFGQMQSGDRVVSAGLRTHGVSAGKCGREFPRRHQQRKIPGNDLAGDAERPRLSGREKRIPTCRPSLRNKKNAPRPAADRCRAIP